MSRAPLAAIDEVWEKRGIVEQASKHFDLAPSATTLGMQLTDGITLRPKGTRWKALIRAAVDLVDTREATTLELASFGGVLQWCDLANRPMLSSLHLFYEFVQRIPQDRLQPVPDSVITELLLNLSLMPFWVIDLTRPW